METRKPFETITLHDPAVDWGATKNPPFVEHACSACGGLPEGATQAVLDGLEKGDLSRAFCDPCGGAGVVRVPEYEPYDEARFAIERDVNRLRFFDGERPTIFVYRRLTRPQFQKWVSLATSHEDRCIRAFQAGVIEIRWPDRPAYRPAWLGRAALNMDEKELVALEQEYGVDRLDEIDVGIQILARSDVPLDCTPVFPVPPSSVDAWAAVQRRSAARNRTGARPTSGAPKGP